MNSYVKFYNFIAEAVRFLEDYTDDIFYTKYRGISSFVAAQMHQKLAEQFPELMEKGTGHPLEIKGDGRWDDDFFARLACFLDQSKKGVEEDKQRLLCLLQKLDIGLSERILSGNDYLLRNTGINCLNTNYGETCIMLLPRCQCLWERNSRGRQYGTGLMNDIKSLYYIRREDMGQYELTNIFLRKTFFQGKKSIKCGMSPVTNQNVLKISYREREGAVYFAIDGLNKENIVRNNVKCIMQRAKEEGVNILIFPEMIGMDGMQADCRQLYEENWDAGRPEIIVFPSMWKECTNTSVITGADASEIGRQQKQNPYQRYVEEYNTEAIEDLNPDRKIVLLHIESIGRIAVVICKDFLIREYRRRILDALKATLIIVPSFSTGNFDFRQVMGECKQYDCGVIWLNCCGAMHLEGVKESNFKDIGYLQFSGKLTDCIGSISIEEESRCNKKTCKENCLFVCEIPLPGKDTGKEGIV